MHKAKLASRSISVTNATDTTISSTTEQKQFRKLDNPKQFTQENLKNWQKITTFWETQHAPDVSVVKEVEHVINNYLMECPNATIADIGCGDAWILQDVLQKQSTDFKYIGIDFNDVMVNKLKERHTDSPNIAFDCLDIQENLPNHLNETADLVIACLSLIEIPDLDAAFRNLNALLKPNGKLVIIVLDPLLQVFRNFGTKTKRFEHILTELRSEKALYFYTKEISSNCPNQTKQYPIIIHLMETYLNNATHHNLCLRKTAQFNFFQQAYNAPVFHSIHFLKR
jgi:ubiquinone/menaquinone biosynthesis C-methylase UbiE